MRIGKFAKTVAAGALAVACLTSVAACGPGSSNNNASDVPAEEVSTDLGDGTYELTLWDGAGLKALDDALIAGFQEKYPNITITATYDPDNVTQQNGPRIISASDTPDLARITDIGSAARGNHLVNLEEYADATTERGQCMLKSICDKMGFDSLGFQSVEGLIEAIGLDPEKLCTYCWTGKE